MCITYQTKQQQLQPQERKKVEEEDEEEEEEEEEKKKKKWKRKKKKKKKKKKITAVVKEGCVPYDYNCMPPLTSIRQSREIFCLICVSAAAKSG